MNAHPLPSGDEDGLPQPFDFDLSILGRFGLAVDGQRRCILPHASQRLLAFLALQDRIQSRSFIAATLWPDVSEFHAKASLRSALTRLGSLERTVLNVTPRDISLAPHVSVDYRKARLLVQRLLLPTTQSAEGLGPDAITTLSLELLPDWDDEWLVAEAERWHQSRLFGLESLPEMLLADQHFAEAIPAALAVLQAAPLRETANAMLIRIHLAQGNRTEALSAYEKYRDLLHAELGIEPTDEIKALVKEGQDRYDATDLTQCQLDVQRPPAPRCGRSEPSTWVQ